MSRKACFCRDQFTDVKGQLDLVLEKAISLGAVIVEALIQFKGELTRLQKKCDWSRHCTATEKRVVTVLSKKLEEEVAMVSDLESESTVLVNEIYLSSKTHTEAKAGLC